MLASIGVLDTANYFAKELDLFDITVCMNMELLLFNIFKGFFNKEARVIWTSISVLGLKSVTWSEEAFERTSGKTLPDHDKTRCKHLRFELTKSFQWRWF